MNKTTDEFLIEFKNKHYGAMHFTHWPKLLEAAEKLYIHSWRLISVVSEGSDGFYLCAYFEYKD